MLVSMIAAVAQNGTIGRNNQLPWHVADDLQFFVETTKAHVVITGRKNFDAMGGPLPGRSNIVVTRRADFRATNANVTSTLEGALVLAEDAGEAEVFIIGGAQLYAAAKPYAHRFYRTRILADVDGDVKYEDHDWDDWDIERIGAGEANKRNEYSFEIELLTRRLPPLPYRASARRE